MNKNSLIEGSIIKKILYIAWPLILTNVINMMYNVTDMFWVAKLGSNSVAAVGSAGLFIWLAQSCIILTKLGSEVLVGQSVGANNKINIKKYAVTGIITSMGLAAIIALLIFVFKDQLMNIFGIKDLDVINQALEYLKYGSIGIFFILLTQVFAAVYNGLANTLLVLKFITVGLLVNMVLDPLFILIFDMGAGGAAIATSIAAAIPVLLFINHTIRHTDLFENWRLNYSKIHLKKILKLSWIPCLQNIVFASVMIMITRIIATFGPNAIAAQRIGNQIESMGWMIGLGISTATSIFVSQNFGAKQYERSVKGYKTIVSIFFVYGLILSYVFIFHANSIFKLFLDDEASLSLGISYLVVLGYGQFLQILEMITTGFFNGIGKTAIPGIISFTGNVMRIPLALYFSKDYGIQGIWYALAISMFYKGILIIIMFIRLLIKDNNFNLKMLLR